MAPHRGADGRDELVRGLGFDGGAVHFLEFDAVEMLWERVGVGDLMWGLGAHSSALRSVPVGAFKFARYGLRTGVENTVAALGLDGVVGENGRPSVAVHVFGFAGLNADFEKPDVVVFE